MATRAQRLKMLQQITEDVTQLKGALSRDRVKNKWLPVVGEGAADAKLFFVGEAPGRNEALTGRPFIGAAGKILDGLLASIGLPREQVYITSVLKDRPPQNRDPKLEEIALYGPFLDRQIDIIQPRVIVTLGRFSMDYIFRRYGLENQLAPMSQLHGKVFDVKQGKRTIHILPLYHPAAALYNPKLRETMEADMKQILAFLK